MISFFYSARTVLSKVAIDQLIFTPVGLVIFYTCFKTLEGQPWKVPATIREKFFPTLFAGFAIWPLAHIVNFRFVPTQQRVLFVNGVTVCQNHALRSACCAL